MTELPAKDALRGLSPENRIDAICDRFEAAWKSGEAPVLSDWLNLVTESEQSELFKELLALDVEYWTECGESVSAADYASRFSEYALVIHEVVGNHVQAMAARNKPDVASPASDSLEGMTVDRYRLISKLGEGGFGVVYLASHTSFPNRRYALKLVRPDRIASPTMLARFSREIQALSDLDHPNVVYASDAGEWNGLPYLTMDYVDGLSLRRLIELHGTLEIADACEVIRQAATGMQHVHEKGRMHRDLKPANLMLDHSGVVRILDLGLARLRSDIESEGDALTVSGQIMGTPDYMAPEQWDDSSAVDIRADIYSLGCTLFCLLTGRAPFADEEHRGTTAKMRAHTTHEAPDVFGFRDDVPPELAAIVQQCLSKSPDDRVQSPDELATALAPWSENSDLPALMEQTPASLRHDAAFESTDIVTNHAASTLGSQSGEATETTEGSGQAASAELSGKQALHRRRTGWMLTTGIAAAAVLAATIYHSRTRPTGTGEQNQGRVADTGNSPLPETNPPPSDSGLQQWAARVGAAERDELLTLLRDLIQIDVARVTLSRELREFADEPDKNKWLALQSRATENREEIRQLIQELEEIQSRFLLDETSTFRQLLIDLHSKQSRYDQILGLKSEQAISESEAVIAIAEAYQMLIESIQNHEKVIREYIRDMEQESQGQ